MDTPKQGSLSQVLTPLIENEAERHAFAANPASYLEQFQVVTGNKLDPSDFDLLVSMDLAEVLSVCELAINNSINVASVTITRD